MLLPLSILPLLAASPNSTASEIAIPDPSWRAPASASHYSAYYDAPANQGNPTRWKGAPGQAGYGVLGTLAGSIVGGAAGYGLGALAGNAIYGDRPEHPYREPLYRINTADRVAVFGSVVGMTLGLSAWTGYLVSDNAQTEYASPGFWIPTLGALTGGTAMVLTAAAIGGNTSDSTSGPGDVIGGLATFGLLLVPSLGAVVADRVWAHSPLDVTLVPWMPKSGQQGLRVGLAF